ncbi:RNI-like protein [Yamadazyma tenuis ATCC 10573]|uniref:RNI-like protein n=1 Tax=Candida tenuis (strain ATCC 10573 / BCRC 21748 / CBS 615 / JCM 9827 / NBRC 10315 / NRRL Y-1498 / VKM Y-70) TaxID=590646 RepID=G3BDD5_CANTC|nr:RNI-like protein [Yamadazyma tenuis ATCC 10573]EGV60932.1 RNI-like protein [Yamadazyma tenuis ATCC 10573]
MFNNSNMLSNNHSTNNTFEMTDIDDADTNFQELKESLVNIRSRRSEIQTLNYRNSPLLNLPTEVLLQIFHHLDRRDLFSLLTVCREFSELIIEILWFRPNMQSDMSFKHIRQIMSLPPHTTHWNYRLYIKRLNLSFMTKLVNDDLLSLFIGCPKLERLTLVNCNKLSRTPISNVLDRCERLQSIDLTGVTDIQDDIFLTLARNCPRLQGLYAPGCGNVSEDAVITLLRACPMLKRIKFNNSENITDHSILAMYENCKSLVEVDLHNCPEVTDLYLRKIFLELSQLREFRISNAPGITDNLLGLLPNSFYLEKLRIIDMTGCNAITDKFVEKLVICAQRLRNVVLSKCLQITDASLRALSKLGRSLHYLHLGHCLLITDFGVTSLVRYCHRIQYIDLACCSQLTDWSLAELATLPKLRRIGLVKCHLITDNGIVELVRRRGEQDCLERVHLSYCTRLSIGPIYLLLKTCPRLTHLSLTGIQAFLRREITQYCREPPPDFNEYQKSLFCVFSGDGVNQLRNHLQQIMEDRAYALDQGEGQPQLDNPPPMGNFGATGTNDEEGISLWARQRGLGILRDNNEMTPNEIQDINREIFTELTQGDGANNQQMTPGERAHQQLRENFTRFIRSQEHQRFSQRAMAYGQRRGGVQIMNGIGSNAPQISQPAVFPNEGQPDIPIMNDDEDGDVEMSATDLFGGTNNNGA